ncbi:MAG: RsmE family RNA methyltransferase [Candidatus Omnitrophota bacterium]
MSKVRIYLESRSFDETIRIEDRQLIHKAKDVLRLKNNEAVYLFDGKGKEYQYVIEKLTPTYFIAKKVALARQEEMFSCRIVLAFPLVKEEKIDFILQKATELGVSEFLPFTCARSIGAFPSCAKRNRWQKIIIEAGRQAQRLWLPILCSVVSFRDMLGYACDTKFVATITGEDMATIAALHPRNILVAIGPEGDFSPEEYQLLRQNCFRFLSLSDYILRVETAGIFAVGLLRHWLSYSGCSVGKQEKKG